MHELPDIQGTEPNIKRSICQVGVESVKVPFKLESKYGGFHQMIADVSMRTNLESDKKGISMSRLIRTLKKYLDLPLKKRLIYEILKDLAENVESTESFMRFDFLLPVIRKSVLSDHQFPIYHSCRFEGHLSVKPHKETKEVYGVEEPVVYDGKEFSYRFFQGAIVQYASYCPCSAELSSHLMSNGSMGFPHAQRSYAHILLQGNNSSYIWLEDIIEAVEKAIKTIPYPIIKRVDEQEIARIAAENPIFVEDAIRAISDELDALEGVSDWIVKCIHEESIHTSEAIAVDYKGIEGGFDYRYFL